MAYDRKQGGWRGPVTHLDIAADGAVQVLGGQARPATCGAGLGRAAGQVARPPGMLPDWRLGVVLSLSDSEAKLGWLEPAAQVQPAAAAAHRRVAAVGRRLGAAGEGRQARAGAAEDGRCGAAGRRGDGRAGRRAACRHERRGCRRRRPLPRSQASSPASAGRGGEVCHAGASAALAGSPGAAADPAGAGRAGVARSDHRAGAGDGRRLELRASQFNRATQAKRQPGSSFKPFVYLTALEHGISPSQRFLDAPVVVDQRRHGNWRPDNYEGNFGGPTPLRVALEQSHEPGDAAGRAAGRHGGDRQNGDRLPQGGQHAARAAGGARRGATPR